MSDPNAVLAALMHNPALVADLVGDADPAILRRRPSPAKWSIHEHAVHLAEVHPLFFRRLDRMLTEVDPVITPYNPTREEEEGGLLEQDLGGAMKRYAQDRARLVERLKPLAPADWQRSARHPEYALYTIQIMFRHLALHDLFHAYRIEELVLKPTWD